MTWEDEIVEEVRAAREAYAAQFDFDVARMVNDLREKEQRHAGRLADLKPLRPIPESEPAVN